MKEPLAWEPGDRCAIRFDNAGKDIRIGKVKVVSGMLASVATDDGFVWRVPLAWLDLVPFVQRRPS